MNQENEFRFLTEKVISIPGRGVVVSGKVEHGIVSLGDEIGFLATDGKWISALVIGIEVSRHLVEETKAGEEASLLLEGVRKDQIPMGTILTAVPTSPVAIPSAPEEIYSTPIVSTYSPAPMANPIHPSSSLWRTVFFVVVGLLILFAIFYLDWKP